MSYAKRVAKMMLALTVIVGSEASAHFSKDWSRALQEHCNRSRHRHHDINYLRFSGPSEGFSNVRSEPFLVSVVARRIDRPITITLKDDNGSGDFSPATITFTENSRIEAFYYTPRSIGRRTISVSNSMGFTNPDSIEFNVTTTADTLPPTVSILSPIGGASVAGVGVPLTVTASDNVGVVGVEYLLDEKNVGGSTSSPSFTVLFDSTQVANGNHTLTAIARDAAGNASTSSSVMFIVNNFVPPPPPPPPPPPLPPLP